ncbi:MAG TPA: glutaminase, partial [Candidatus Eisenbacteria bacterium]|nr:glutaminase [Candidatus Eisenbacteria bacterium]
MSFKHLGVRAGLSALTILTLAAGPALAQKGKTSGPDYQGTINQTHAKYLNLQEGKNADYIPALAKVDSKIYGIALVTVDGKVFTTGDITS